MRHPMLLATLVALGLVPSLPAQNCFHLPADTPGLGNPDPRPFGNGNANDPTYGTMRYQVQLPAGFFGTQPVRIRELYVAPAGSRVRTFAEVQVRFGHNPNPITTQMVFNQPGFTANLVQHTVLSFPTTADQWLALGMNAPFLHNPAQGQLVLEFFVRQAGASAGTGDVGLRTDPSLPFVWTSGSGYNGTMVAGGGIKLRFCTDAHGFLEYGVGGCVGSNAQRPALTYGGSAQLGSTMHVQLSGAPITPATLTILVWSFRPRVGPFDLGGFGAPGCSAYVFGDQATWLFSSTGSQSSSITLPLTLQPGFPVWNQWFVGDPAANTLGFTGSNFGRVMVGN